VFVEAAFEPTMLFMDDCPETNDGVGLAPKYPSGVLIVMKSLISTETLGVNTTTGNTTEPAPLLPMVNVVKAVIAVACDPVTHAKAIKT